MAEEDDSVQQGAVSVNRVALKPPPFWKGDPSIWFAQIEAQFSLSGITNETTKYYHVISAIDTEILTQVADIIQKPLQEGRYGLLKARLIDLYTDSNEKKLRKLLSEIELGDKKPSTLLNEMQRLGGTSLSAELLKSLWLQHLPVTTQSCLAVANGSIEELAKLADKVSEIGQSRMVATVTNDTTTELLKTLIKEVSELKLERQSRSESRHSRSNSRSRSRSKFRPWEQAKEGMCFYHTNFKHKAKKCVEPCKHFAAFTSKSEN